MGIAQEDNINLHIFSLHIRQAVVMNLCTHFRLLLRKSLSINHNFCSNMKIALFNTSVSVGYYFSVKFQANFLNEFCDLQILESYDFGVNIVLYVFYSM